MTIVQVAKKVKHTTDTYRKWLHKVLPNNEHTTDSNRK